MIIKENEYQGLQEFDVLIEDTNPTSDYFQVTEFPETIPGGKSFFKISAAAGLLRSDSEIRVEVLDSNGEVIYTEYPDFVDESDRRIISMFVYDNIPPGSAVVTILGEAEKFTDETSVPIDWVGTFNVRWSRTLNVEPFKKNNFPILFEREPAIAVTEIVKPYLERVVPSGSSVTTVGTTNNSNFKVSLETRGEGKFYLVSQGGFAFENEMVNSAVTFSALTNPTLNKKGFPQLFGKGPETFTIDGTHLPYYANIIDIVNDTRVQVKNPFSIKTEFSKTGKEKSEFDKDFDEKFTQNGNFSFDPSSFSIEFRKKPTFTATQNLRSFAKIQLNDLNTISGDVHHIKTFMKSQGSVGGFELVDETVLEATELLINEDSVDLKEPTGEFFSQAVIDDSWNLTTINMLVNEFTASRETSNLNNSVFLSGSFRSHSGSITFSPKSNINFATNGDYELTFKSFVDLDSNSVDDGHSVDVYLTGSSFFSSSNYVEPYGVKIGTLESSGSKYFGKSDIDFTTTETGDGNVLFHVKRGLWRFSDISIRSVKESGFSPSTTTIYIPVPTEAQDDVLDFEFKFYDNDNNEASASFQKLDNDFAGGNTFIGGGSNILTGSMFIGDSTGSGIEAAGVQSAFFRSVGYDGYESASMHRTSGSAGFMLFSGSVLSDSTSEYSSGGVGFEFHGGSGSAGESSLGAADGRTNAIRFHSNTGILEVTGSIVAEDGIIAGWAIGTSSISKNGVELSSQESGLRVVNPAGREVVYVGSRSLQEVSGSGVTSSFNGSFEISNVPAVQGSGVIVSQSNQISGWGIQYTGSTGNAKIETGTTYPSASVIAVDEDKVLIIVNAAGTV